MGKVVYKNKEGKEVTENFANETEGQAVKARLEKAGIKNAKFDW